MEVWIRKWIEKKSYWIEYGFRRIKIHKKNYHNVYRKTNIDVNVRK